MKKFDKEPVAWITRGGKHIPIFDDEEEDPVEKYFTPEVDVAQKFFADQGGKVEEALEFDSIDEAEDFLKKTLNKNGWKYDLLPLDSDLKYIKDGFEISGWKGKGWLNIYTRTDGKRTFVLFDTVPLGDDGFHTNTNFEKIPKIFIDGLRIWDKR